MLNWNFLETFVILAENLSFSETAKLLNTAQPVISRQIKTLESNLGYALFLRSKKSVTLSPEGQELKRKLSPLVGELKRVLLADRSLLTPLLKVEIRMGSMHEAGELLLFPRVSRFMEVHPDSTVHLSLMGTAQVNEQVAKGLLDFGFVYEVPQRKSVKAFPVIQDVPVLIANRRTAAEWKKQAVYPLVSYREQDLYSKAFLDRYLSKSERSRMRSIASVNSHRAMIELIRKHPALAVIPRSSAQAAVDKGLIEILEQDKKPQTLHLVCHEQILIDPRKKAFLDFLLKEFKNSP